MNLRRFWVLAEQVRGSDTGRAAGLAIAMIVYNVLGLIASIVFARELNDYGALAALVSYLMILTVFGQALQVATARESVLGHLGQGPGLLDTVGRWGRSLALFTAVAAVGSVLARQPIADLVGVPHYAWAAAAGIPAGCAYLGVCTLRGVLQGIGDYRSVAISLVGEGATRVLTGTLLAAAGLGVAGAYLGSLLSYVIMLGYCTWRLRCQLADRQRVPCSLPLWRHVRAAAVAIIALGVIQLLQNLDLITAKHQFSDRVASSYAVVAVAAKVLIWVAMGAGFYLVPETSRRRADGEDARPVLLRTLGIVAVCAIPCMLIFAFGAHPLLAAVFGKRRAVASASLLPLGAAFTVLACTYLAVQYMLALKRTAFLGVLALVAIAEPILLLHASRRPASFAAVVLVVQVVGAALAFGLALWRRSDPAATDPGAIEPGAIEPGAVDAAAARTGRAAPQTGRG